MGSSEHAKDGCSKHVPNLLLLMIKVPLQAAMGIHQRLRHSV